MLPSCAVTLTAIGLLPTFKVIGPEALPDVTAVPFTVTVAPLLDVIGFTVVEVTPFFTVKV